MERVDVREFLSTTDESLRVRVTIGLAVIAAAVLFGLMELASEPETAWIGIPGLLVALTVGGLGLRRAILDRAHLSRSTTAPGTVIGAVQAGKLNPSIRPVFRFTSLDGVEHEAAATFPQRALGEGRTMAVRYDTTDPAWVVIDGEDYRRSRDTVRAVAALVGPAALALVVALARLVG